MILMMQNLASKPKISCNTITAAVIIMGFLYLMNFSFTISNNLNLQCRNFYRPYLIR